MKTTLAFVLTLTCLSACAGSPSSKTGDTEVYRLSQILENDVKALVVIETTKFNADSFYNVSPVLWGSEAEPPSSVLKNIYVAYGHKKSLIRYSAYADLVNVKQVKLKAADSGFYIMIDGGDTSTHYKAELFFDNEGFLVRRKVYSPTFSDEVWEETHYSYIRRAEM
jgi:hypothetical protein